MTFGFAELVHQAEALLLRDLELVPLPLDPLLGRAEGAWKGNPATIETCAYTGGPIRYARFAVVRSAGLEIGNVLCLPSYHHPLPILGADLVAVRETSGMVAVDLSPTLPPGAEREEQLAPLARLRSSHPSFPPGGELPSWCADWFSPYALYTRGSEAELSGVGAAFLDFVHTLTLVARRSPSAPERITVVVAVQAGYLEAHLTDDKGLNLLRAMFGRAWANRYLEEVLFPRVPLSPVC